MVTIPVRGLAAKGILRDPSPYELDLDAWSGGANMRFHANKAERSPIFRTVYDAMPTPPIFCVGYEPSTGYDQVMVMDEYAHLWQYVSGSLTDISAVSTTTTTSTTNELTQSQNFTAPPWASFSTATNTVTNQLTQSEAFDQAPWQSFVVSGTAPVVTPNVASGPTGSGTTADQLALASASSGIYYPTNAGGPNTFSVWVKLVSGSGAFTLNYYEASTTSPSFTHFTATTTWQQFNITFNGDGNASSNVSIMFDPTQSTPGTFELWGAQINSGTTVETYVPTSGSPASTTVSSTSGAPVVVANTETAPSGNGVTAASLTLSTPSSGIYYPTTVTGQNTFSVWIKLLSGSGNLTLNYFAGATNTPNFQPVVATSQWTRISQTFTGDGNAGSNISIMFDPSQTVTGTFAIWGAQINSGPAAGPYVPTAGSTATQTTTTTTAGPSNTPDPRAATSTTLGDVIYVNRPDSAPWYYGPNSTTFQALPNMESAWTCRSLRAFGDYLIALNVTKPTTWTDPHTGTAQPGGDFPNLFKWSDLTLFGQTPGSWDYLNPTTSAGENPLEQLTTPLVDGIPMRSNFVIYSENSVWMATQTGDVEIFAWQELFSEGGMIAPNCGVEVNGVHYVFGPTDLYRHDGVTKQSIIDKRNKQTFFRYLNKQKSEVCFVSYVPALDSVFFCCNSGDPSVAFPGVDRCNWAAVYDIPGDTWSFIDLPNVSAMTQANLDTVLTYASAPSTVTYASVGGSYYDQENSFVKSTIVCSGKVTGTITNSRLLGYDFADKGSLSFPQCGECSPPAWVERVGIDLDQFGSDLGTYKLVRRVFPQVTMYNSTPIQIFIGGALMPSGTPVYKPPLSFNPISQYKVDAMTGGRYIALKFSVNTLDDFEVSGFDLDVTDNGHR